MRDRVPTNDDNNVPEQKAMTVDTQGYEQVPFEDISQKRPRTSFRSGQSYRKRWLISRTSERDHLSSEVRDLEGKVPAKTFTRAKGDVL